MNTPTPTCCSCMASDRATEPQRRTWADRAVDCVIVLAVLTVAYSAMSALRS